MPHAGIKRWTVVLPILACLAGLAEAKDHVLIMAISQYQQSPKLAGAAVDKNNARELAERMGFQASNATVLADAQLDSAGMRKALNQLEGRLADGDRVFIYYSGHGTSFRNEAGRCEQGIVPYDEKELPSSEIAALLTRMRDRASRVIVMLDSCFSGGVTKAAGGGIVSRGSAPRLTPKLSRRGGAEECDNPTNLIAAVVQPPVARGGLKSKAAYNPEQNFVFISASRDNEISLDAGPLGGLATSSLLKCLKGDTAKDADASGSLSFNELVACAQGEIAGFFPSTGEIVDGGMIYKPHHLTLSGNDGMPVAAAPVQAGAQNAPANPKATLQDLFRGRDATWDIRLDITPNRLRIGKDAFRVSVTSKRAGYLYLLYVGSDDKEFSLLYPDASDPEGSNLLEPGKELVIPGEFKANGPAGADHFVAYVSQQPRPSILKVFDKDGAAAATLGNAAAITKSTCSTRNVSRQACAPEVVVGRNVTRQHPAAEASQTAAAAAEAPAQATQAAEVRDGYGAAFAEIIEE